MNIYRNFFAIFVVVLLSFPFSISQAESMNLKMVFVPASEKGDDKDYVNLINIIGDLTGIEITPIRVTDYNAAVEAVRANRAQIAWYGGKTYIQAAEIADVEAFAAGVRKGDTDASYFAYFVVPADSKLMAALNKHADVCGMSSRNFDARILDGTFKLEQVRIIHRSNPVPPPPLAYSKKLPIEVRNKIKQATLEAHKYGTIGGYGGEMSHYIEVTDADYDLLREVDRLLSSQQ